MQLFLNLFPVFFPVLIRHIARYAPHKNKKILENLLYKSWNKFQTASKNAFLKQISTLNLHNLANRQ